MRGGMGQARSSDPGRCSTASNGSKRHAGIRSAGLTDCFSYGPHGALIGAVMAVGAALATAYAPSVIGAKDRTKELQEQLKNTVKGNECRCCRRNL